MLFFSGETNGLSKGSSIAVVGRSGKGNNIDAGERAGEHAGKHVGEGRNEDVVGEDLVRSSVRRYRCEGILVELLLC